MRIALAGVAMLVASCVGTDVGNPPDDRRRVATLDFATYEGSSDGPADSHQEQHSRGDGRALVTGSDSGLELAWLSVQSVALGSCAGDDTREVLGPFAVDLRSGNTYPATPTFEDLDDGEFCTIKVRLGVSDELPEQAPPELAARSVVVAGVTPDGLSYLIHSDVPRTLGYRGAPFPDGEQTLHLVTAFAPSQWLEGLRLPTEESDKSERQDLTSSTGNASRFLTNLSNGSRVVEDVDTDRKVSDDEFERPIASAEPL